jgi:N-carbamoylputrescine amidase
MRTASLAALQFSCSWTRDDNIAKADRLVRQAARQGAQVALPLSARNTSGNPHRGHSR